MIKDIDIKLSLRTPFSAEEISYIREFVYGHEYLKRRQELFKKTFLIDVIRAMVSRNLDRQEALCLVLSDIKKEALQLRFKTFEDVVDYLLELGVKIEIKSVSFIESDRSIRILLTKVGSEDEFKFYGDCTRDLAIKIMGFLSKIELAYN